METAGSTLVTCPGCGARSRVQRQAGAGRAVCGRCSADFLAGKEESSRKQAFDEVIRAEVDAFLRDWAGRADECRHTVAGQPTAAGADQIAAMNTAFQDAANQAVTTLVEKLNMAAARQGRVTLGRTAVAELRQMLTPATVEIPQPKEGDLSTGAIIGGIIGTLLFPGVGSVIGLTLGGATGAIGEQLGEGAAFDRAVATAVSSLSEKRDAIIAFLLERWA
jgi:hypothetical protein